MPLIEVGIGENKCTGGEIDFEPEGRCLFHYEVGGGKRLQFKEIREDCEWERMHSQTNKKTPVCTLHPPETRKYQQTSNPYGFIIFLALFRCPDAVVEKGVFRAAVTEECECEKKIKESDVGIHEALDLNSRVCRKGKRR